MDSEIEERYDERVVQLDCETSEWRAAGTLRTVSARTELGCVQRLADNILEFAPGYLRRHELAEGGEVGLGFLPQRSVELAFDGGRRGERHGKRCGCGNIFVAPFLASPLPLLVSQSANALMERPVTSKPRGICRYYTTPKGCYNGDSCKFLHGANERLTPYDKSKVCRYHIKGLCPLVSLLLPHLDLRAGYCSRGDQCWFRHELVVPSQPTHEQTEPDAGMCSICLEKPVTYGLLSASPANHVVVYRLTLCSGLQPRLLPAGICIFMPDRRAPNLSQCIRQWRATEDKSLDMVTTGVIKSCPLCRRPSRFVTPSTHFFPSDHPKKTEIIEGYRASMARVPCKYAARFHVWWCG